MATAGESRPSRQQLGRWLPPLICGAALLLVPVPAGLAANAWHYFALFVAVVVALITEPVPGAVAGFIGVSIAAALMLVGKTPAESTRWALSGFSNDTVWLIFAANMFALGYESTGLGRRIALLFVRTLGGQTLGLGYALALTDLVLAPVMPSVTARSGGTLFPIVNSIPPLYGSYPNEHPRKMGSYLMWTAFATSCVTSSMFLTAFAPNLLAIDIARRVAHVEISWGLWLRGFLPIGIILFAATPLLAYWLAPPEVKSGREVADWAGQELAKMGAVSRREVTMVLLALAALGGWIGAAPWLSPVTVAMAVISLMLLAGVITWREIVGKKEAWGMLVWFATLVALADGLNSVGFLTWFAQHAASLVGGIGLVAMLAASVGLFFLVHYLFASVTAQTTALLPVFLLAVISVPGVPALPAALLLCYSLGLMGVISPYASGPAPIYYGAGYIPTRDFWKMGAIMGAIYLVVLLGAGIPYVLALA
jgi:L-tartrate/succinate antiporter